MGGVDPLAVEGDPPNGSARFVVLLDSLDLARLEVDLLAGDLDGPVAGDLLPVLRSAAGEQGLSDQFLVRQSRRLAAYPRIIPTRIAGAGLDRRAERHLRADHVIERESTTTRLVADPEGQCHRATGHRPRIRAPIF